MYRDFLALAFNPQTTGKAKLPRFNKYICYMNGNADYIATDW